MTESRCGAALPGTAGGRQGPERGSQPGPLDRTEPRHFPPVTLPTRRHGDTHHADGTGPAPRSRANPPPARPIPGTLPAGKAAAPPRASPIPAAAAAAVPAAGRAQGAGGGRGAGGGGAEAAGAPGIRRQLPGPALAAAAANFGRESRSVPPFTGAQRRGGDGKGSAGNLPPLPSRCLRGARPGAATGPRPRGRCVPSRSPAAATLRRGARSPVSAAGARSPAAAAARGRGAGEMQVGGGPDPRRRGGRRREEAGGREVFRRVVLRGNPGPSRPVPGRTPA